MAASEEEIYSIMFTSLKHPVRRKILRMLADKPLTFMEMVDNLGVSTSHLTYHLESLGELVSKMDDGKYRLSSFGQATVTAMKGVEEPSETQPARRHKMAFKWKAVFAALMVAVLILAVMASIQYVSLNQLTIAQSSLAAENQQLLSWGVGTGKAANLLGDVAQIDTKQYKISLLSDTLEYRQDFGVSEELLKYSLTNGPSNLDVDLRFRDNHLSRYQLTNIENQPVILKTQEGDMLQLAKDTLNRYKTYSGDAYLDDMGSLLSTVSKVGNLSVTEGNLKLQITSNGGSVEFLWMYTEKGIDFSAKSLRMNFQNHVLVGITDGYFLFTVANTNLQVTEDNAVSIAKNYVKTLTWTFNGKQTTGFDTEDQPVLVELVPHPRNNSVA